jgi:small GTP-binding protein
MESLKIVCVGDGATGKSSNLAVFSTNKFMEFYEPTIFDNMSAQLMLDYNGRQIVTHLQLWDTAGQESFENMRKLSYPGTNIFILCYSVISPTSYANVKSSWIPEIRRECGPDIPIFLVGTKTDLRDEDEEFQKVLEQKNIKPLTYDDGMKLLKEYNLAGFMECSAKTQYNIQPLFKQVTILGLDHKYKKSNSNACISGCSLM